MKRSTVVVPWEEGLHLRPAAEIVKRAKGTRSSIWLRARGKVADARSIMAIALLAATAGTFIELEVSGEDEVAALASVEDVFRDTQEG